MKRILSLFLFLFVIFCTPAIAQKDKGTPREGEGIHAFLKRYKRTDNEHYKQFIELNKGKFGKNNSLIKDRTYFLPPLSVNKTASNNTESSAKQDAVKINKLFGKKYENFTVKSSKLKGASFYLSSGHGGPDPGAIGKVDGYELHEDEYAYDITLRLARCLLEEGATVYMIIQDAKDGIRDDKYLSNSRRETCMGSPIPLNQKKRLRQRAEKINSLSKKDKNKYKRALFVHLDSRSKKKQLDVFFYYANKSKGGQKLAKTMRDNFESHYKKHQPNRGFTGTVSVRDLYVLNNVSPISLFAELGNIQNTFDQRRFLDPNNRQALANWMCRGFIQDYENYKKDSK